MVLLLSDSRGIYIPKDFTNGFENWQGLSDDDREILANPENELYWDVWQEVLDNAFFVAKDEPNLLEGKWTLYQDGDLWAVHESHEWDNN